MIRFMLRSQLLVISALMLFTAQSLTAAEHPPLARAPFDAGEAAEFQQQWAAHIRKPVVEENSIGMKMVLIPPGEFLMGMKDEAAVAELKKNMLASDGYWDRVLGKGIGPIINLPGHRVRLNRPFYMGAHEVTVGQFRKFIEQSGYKTDAERGLVYEKPYQGEQPIRTWQKTFYEQPDDHPVLQVGWKDCMAFCKWLTEQETSKGHVYSLPTDAEWEYACRAGSRTEYSFGDDPSLLADYAWVVPPDAPHPRERQWPELTVGKRQPNAWGIHDMHGNAWEWVQDWWDKDYYSKSPLVDPKGPTDGALKVLRGGAVKSYGRFARSAFRLFVYPDIPDDDRSLLTGARLVINLPDTDPVLVSHRGMLRSAPENTLPAFEYCLDCGMGFELDIRTSKDGKLVVLHDNALGRTTNGPDRSVREFTLAELKKFDAGSWFDPAFANERIPTLEETFKLIRQRRHDRTIIALNVKDVTQQGEKRLVQLVEKYGLLDDSFAFDQSEECSRRLKALNPKLRIGSNVNRKTIDTRLKEGLLDVFLVTFTPTAGEVQRLHGHGKQVVYNFGGSAESRRNPEVWSKARDSGIDGLLTDFPLECRQHWQTSKGGERE